MPDATGTEARVPWGISRRQLVALALTSLTVWSLGNGLLPLLPVLASILGASPEIIGGYLALSYGSLALGTIAAGWVTDRVGHRKLLLVGPAAAMAPITAAVSLTRGFAPLVPLTMAVWFLGGWVLTLVNILAGLSAGSHERGKVFGLLAAVVALGAVIGGLGIGPLVDLVGYLPAFPWLGLAMLLAPVFALFVADPDAHPRRRGEAEVPRPGRRYPTGFLFLVVASTLSAVALFVGIFGRSLALDALGYGAGAITSTVAVSGLVTLPVAVTLGALSDRLGRTGFLALCFGASCAGLVAFAGASVLWHFWVASALIAFVSYAAASVGAALVTDLVPASMVGRGMAAYNATLWVGAVIGFPITGFAIATLDFPMTFLFGAVVAGLSTLLLIPVWSATKAGADLPRTGAL